MRSDDARMPGEYWRFGPMGDTGLLLHWHGTGATEQVRRLYAALGARQLAGVDDLVPGLDSLLVCYDPLQLTGDDLVRACRACEAGATEDEHRPRRLVEIAVRYGGADGPDLGDIAEVAGISEAEVVALHTAGPMPVLMVGFMPGFPYIGGLPPRLYLPRRAEPRTAVPAGSVALANDQTGIYPSRAPGGWHLIGRTEAALFDPRRVPPALLAPGDLVQFVALSQP